MEKLMDLMIQDHLQFRDEHKSLLKSQVLLTEIQERANTQIAALAAGMAEAQKRINEEFTKVAQAQKELYEAQKHTDERLDALIAVMDGLIRRENRPPR